MSQRLASAISLKPLTLLGHRSNGKPIYNIAGGSVDAGEGATPPAGTEGTPDPEGTGTDESSDPPPLSKEEFDKALERMRAADRRASAKEQELTAAQQKLKEYEDKDKTELERANAAVEQANKERDDARAALRAQQVNNAFLTSNKHVWHNPERALSLLDLSEVTIGDDGTVLGIDKAIESLAKSDPYLIKADDDNKPPPPGSSGVPAGSGGGKKNANSREQLMDKYPALRR